MALRALVAAAFAVPAAESYPTYIPFNPNGANVPMPGMPGMFVPSIGHINPAGGGDRNAYGKAFAAAGRSWSAQLCAEDSDGDGASNGLEVRSLHCALAWSLPHLTRVPPLAAGRPMLRVDRQ
jgi:hypothetical protein